MENHQLRQELQELIDVTNALQVQKKRLEKQYRCLLREHQFSQNLKQLRGAVFRGPDVSSQLPGQESDDIIILPKLKQ